MSTAEPGGEAEVPTGVRALAAEEFSLTASIGGVRGAVEAVLPGIVFVAVYVLTEELRPALFSALGVALLAVVARLVQRTPATQAFAGFFGVGIGAFWAWKSGDASDYFAYGLYTNGAYLLVLLVTVLARWPVVGLVVEGLRAGFGAPPAAQQAQQTPERVEAEADAALVSGDEPEPAPRTPVWSTAWRQEPDLMRRYTIATWLWIAMFAARLTVQVPLYLDSSVGWLGTARLVMGIPLWALVLWATWVLVRRPAAPSALPGTRPAP